MHLDRKEATKKRKSNKDPGFTSWADNTARQYNRMTKEFKPDWERKWSRLFNSSTMNDFVPVFAVVNRQ